MRLLIIGKAGSGKDTVADYLIDRYGFEKRSFAAKLKEIALDLFPEWHKTDRRSLLQQLGSKMRELDEDVWVNYLLDDIEGEEGSIAITDCRYENEHRICSLYHDFIPLKILCDDDLRSERLHIRDGVLMTEEQLSHPSEQLNVTCKYFLDNNEDLDHLYTQIDQFMEDYKCVNQL